MKNVLAHSKYLVVIGLFGATLLLFLANLFWGSIDIPASSVWKCLMGESIEKASWQYIILENRLPQAITAMLSGSALAVSGLMLQTIFRNPLADPSILGIDSGASFGVAISMLFLGGSITAGQITLSGFLLTIIAALAGAIAIMALLLFFSNILRHNMMLLITGIMIGYLTSSAISLLNYHASAEGVFSFMVWGLGNYSSVSTSQLPAFGTIILFGLGLSLLLIKPLNALLLGDRYASNLGINISRTRNLLLWTTGLLTAASTAFCGPISFIGLAVPHLVRMFLNTSNHQTLLPATLLGGASLSLICNLLSTLPGESGMIPLNVITPVIGAPIVIYIIMKQRT